MKTDMNLDLTRRRIRKYFVYVAIAALTSIFIVPLLSPPKAITLQVVDASQVPVTSPVHGKLLIEACENTPYIMPRDPHTISCFLGLLDEDKLIRIVEYRFVVYGLASSLCDYGLDWSPDGTQFLCVENHSGEITTASFVVFDVNGRKKFSDTYLPSWSPDGRYLSVMTCTGSHTEPASGETIYDAYSGEKICSVVAGSYMACSGDKSECKVPLIDGRIWQLKGRSKSNDNIDSFICDQKTGCLPAATVIEQQQHPKLSDRYKVSIVDGELRILDTNTGVEKIYVVPEYRVKEFAWSPD